MVAACLLAGAAGLVPPRGDVDATLAVAAAASDPSAVATGGITRVSIVFACHLDVGFHSPAYPEPGLDNNVINQ